MRVVLLGPPGAGKGTQAQKLAEKLGIPQISTGELFRSNIGNGTKLGLEAKRYLDAGDLVPSELTNQLVDDRLSDPDAANGFILDGYPAVARAGQGAARDARTPRHRHRRGARVPGLARTSCCNDSRRAAAPTTPTTSSSTG